MSGQYVLHIPKATEVYLASENEAEALEWGASSSEDNEWDIITVFQINGDVKTPVAFFWNGQKFVPQKSAEDSA